MSAPQTPALIARHDEFARLDRFVTALTGGLAAAVLHGDPGMGKTTLWHAAAARAEDAGARVLRSRCAEVEMPIAFGALADLLEDLFPEFRDRLPGPQQQALATAFGVVHDGEPRDWLVLASGVRAGLRALAAARPLVLAIDDLQWLDPGSNRILTWALRRLPDTDIGVLVTTREGSAATDPLALATVLVPDRVWTIRLSPLNAAAIGRLIVDRLGLYPPRPMLQRIHQASGGNPLFALALAEDLRASQNDPRDTLPLAVPTSLAHLMRARVAALSATVRPLIELVSAVERPTVQLLQQVFGAESTELQLAEALAVRAIELTDGRVVRLAHPLLAAAVYHGMPPLRRRALHAQLAELVSSQEERGRHIALSTERPNADLAMLVEGAAEAAVARGALDAAAELAGEAVRLTPDDDRAKHRRVLAGARWLVESGEFQTARVRLDGLLTADLPCAVRADALLVRAECELGDRRQLVALLREAERVSDALLPRWHALIRLAHHDGWIAGRTDLAVALAAETLDTALALEDGHLIEASRAALAFYRVAAGEPGARLPDVPRNRADARTRMPWWLLSSQVSLGCTLMWSGEYAQARMALHDEYTMLDRAGRHAHAGSVLCHLSELEWRCGQWRQAELLANEATQRLGDINPTAFPRALLAAATNRPEEAYKIARGALTWAESNDEQVAPPRFHWILGTLELAQGNTRQAYASLAETQALLDAAGVRSPGYLPVLPDLAESLVALGRVDEAERVIERLAATADGHRWALPAIQRIRALVLLSRRATGEAAELAQSAAAGFGAIGAPLEQARAQLVAGRAAKRQGERRRAAEVLEDAIAIFDRLGASPWRQQAEGELRRANPRPRSGQELTDSERRVAELAASGRKNKQIAAELYTTVATVEAHLTRIYRKLAVQSRTELVHRMMTRSIHLDE